MLVVEVVEKILVDHILRVAADQAAEEMEQVHQIKSDKQGQLILEAEEADPLRLIQVEVVRSVELVEKASLF
jgi:hypothetical protein